MKRVLIIGIGNILMMDDGIGICIIEALKARRSKEIINSNSSLDIRFIVGETDVYFCLGEMESADFTIVIDASRLGLPPGSVNGYLIKDLLEGMNEAQSLHDFSLIQALRLYNFQGPGVFIGVEIHKVDYFFGLSEEIKSRFPEIEKKVADFIEKILDNWISSRI